MTEVVMPRLSDTMEEGTILRWLIGDGEEVGRGEELVEIETDKANMTYEADVEGVLEIVAGEGETLPVGAVIARVGAAADGGQADSSVPGHARARESAGAPASAPGGEPSGGERGEAAGGSRARAEGDDGSSATVLSGAAGPAAETEQAEALREAESDLPTGSPVAGADGDADGRGERVKASPLARRIAEERGIDLRGLTGSGPGGRIVKTDVQAAAGGAETAAKAGAGSEAGAGLEALRAGGLAAAADGGRETSKPGGLADVARAKGETTEVELTKSQQTVARRMAESKATIPHFVLQADVDMEACAGLRAELKGLLPETSAREGRSSEGQPRDSPPRADQPGGVEARAGWPGETVPTYNDMVVKAAALALREHPQANASYRDGRLQLYSRVNVGVAVAAESDGAAGGTLVVPTVFDADAKSLGEIARETRTLAAKVRDGSITPPELGGGTFTVSNLGMFGVDAFTAIVNPPQAAILAVGAARPRAVVGERGEIVARERMTLTLACDHRVLYGADAARFLARIREALEAPASLTL